MSNTVKIQVPIDKDVRDALERKAHSYGFDSVQAYIRFWAKAVVDNRPVRLDPDDEWGEPRIEAIARWKRQEAELAVERKAGTLKEFYSAEDLLKDLRS